MIKSCKLRNYFIIFIIILLIIILIINIVKYTYKNNKIANYSEYFSNHSIPSNIYQLWHTDILPDKMIHYNNILKKLNPEFNIIIYSLDMARIFILNNFNKKILNAFDRLKPIAYKSDLWRYCILYKYGGIYLDLKYYPINNFKFAQLHDEEYYCLDIPGSNNGIYNAIIKSKSKNILLLDAINSIVDNVNNNFYGENSLEPTGPLLLKKIFIENKLSHTFLLKHFVDGDIKKILLNDIEILISYPEYSDDKKAYGHLTDYLTLYNEKDIYYKNIIPLNIYQTWHTKNLPYYMNKCVQKLKDTNPEFNYYLFDDDDCRIFIKKYFSKDVLNSFDKLIPGAYKADLWRYCVLYIKGGIYLDIKFCPVNNFKLLNLINKEYFCKDIPSSGSGIYNAIIISKPKNRLLLTAINTIVKNVNKNFYGYSSLEPTGPLLLKKIFSKKNINTLEMYLGVKDNIFNIYLNDKPIFTIYKQYRDEQTNTSNNTHYNTLWKNKSIYA
jgi:mannosyltransferase OCH1-like enzyme